MNELFQPKEKRSIEKAFVGKRILLYEFIDRPIELVDYEIGIGKKSGHRVLYCQIKYRGEYRFYWTEGLKLISLIEKANRAKLPFPTRIGWDNEHHYLIFKKIHKDGHIIHKR